MNKVDTAIKYEKIIPLENKILLKVVNLVDDKDSDGSQSLLRDIAQKRMLDQEVEDFEVTKAMNSCGIVCSAGIECRWVSTDDLVFFGKYAGSETMVESQRHLMIRESDVLFILKK